MKNRKIKGLLVTLCAVVLSVNTVAVKTVNAAPRTISYYGDVNASANMTYNTYTTGPCYGRVGWEDYPVWGYRCYGCGYFEEDPRARNPVPTNVGAYHYWSSLGHKETTVAVANTWGSMAITGSDSDHGDNAMELTCAVTPSEGQSTLEDYSLQWIGPSGNVIATGENCVVTEPGTYKCQMNVPTPGGATVTCNSTAFNVAYAGTYTSQG